MTPIQTLPVAAVLCTLAFCQDQPPHELGGMLAKPSDLSVSCHIDASTRSAQVTIINHTDAPLRLRIGGPMIDFKAELKSIAGKRLRQREVNASSGVRDASIASTQLDSGAQYSEKVALQDLVEIPLAGGTFEVRIGRGLLPLPNDPSQLDPHAIVWCKPMQVTFPPLK